MNRFDIHSIMYPCKELMGTSSRIEKENILKKNADKNFKVKQQK